MQIPHTSECSRIPTPIVSQFLCADMSVTHSLSGLVRKCCMRFSVGTRCVPVRRLFSPSYLGLERYWRNRERIRLSHQQRSYLYDYLRRALAVDAEPIHSELLACFVHVADDSARDQALLVRAVERYSGRNELLRFWNCRVGPCVLRYFYHFDMIDKAREMLLRDDLSDLFRQTICFMLVMNGLYLHGRYDQVLSLYDCLARSAATAAGSCSASPQSQWSAGSGHVEDEGESGELLPSIAAATGRLVVTPNTTLLAFAAAHKMDSEHGVDWMHQQYTQQTSATDSVDSGCLLRRTVALYAASLMQVGRYEQALSVLERRQDSDFGVFRDIKVKLLCRMNNVGEAVQMLKSSFEKCSIPGSPHYRYRCVPDTIEELKTAVSERADAELSSEFERLHDAILAYDYIGSAYLEDILCAPLMGYNRNDNWRSSRRSSTHSQHRYRRSNSHNGRDEPARARGLFDMESQ